MISIKVKHGGSLSKTILEACRQRIRASAKSHTERVKKWRQAEELYTGYLPESEDNAIRRQRREEGTPEYTTIQVPYSYAVAMAAHSYFCSVFLSRSPVFQYEGSTDEGEMQVLAVEALQQYQLRRAKMLPSLYIHLQDTPKYGEAWLYNYWRKDISQIAEIVEEEQKIAGLIPTGKTVQRKVINRVTTYEGNAVKPIHPAKVFTDPRFSRLRFQEGEFVAIEIELSKIDLIKGAELGQYVNIDRLITRGVQGEYLDEGMVENSNDPLLERADVSDFSSHYDPKALDVYRGYEVCIELIPKVWKLGESSYPEKWIFTVDKDFSVVLEARPQGNIHNKFPLTQLQMEPEGYSMYSQSMLEVYSPLQQTISWLVNSHMFNVRSILNNNFLVDPSRVQMNDFESREPGMHIRLKPSAYGTDPRQAIHQIPVADVTQTHLSDINLMYGIGERLGASETVMGVSAPSSRRSAAEIRGDAAFGTSRLKTQSEFFSATGFSDLSSMMLMNSQQFLTAEMKLRIAGATAQLGGPNFINVNAQTIAGQYDFEPVDGTLPIDRFAMVNLWSNLLGQMAQVPEVMMQYDLGKIFGYVAQLGGIKNLNRFKIDVVPDEQLMNDASAGNVVPMKPEGNPLEPGQIPGVGPTA